MQRGTPSDSRKFASASLIGVRIVTPAAVTTRKNWPFTSSIQVTSTIFSPSFREYATYYEKKE